MAQSQCQLEIIIPTPNSAPMPTQSLSELKLRELRELATRLNITPTGDRRQRATYETAINNATVAPSQNKLDAVVTAWNNDDRTVTVQPVGRPGANDSKTIALNHPWEPNPEWRLTPGNWLVGSITVEQWAVDRRRAGQRAPPICRHRPRMVRRRQVGADRVQRLPGRNRASEARRSNHSQVLEATANQAAP